MKKKYTVYNPIGPDGNPSAVLLSRCLRDAEQGHYDVRFYTVEGGYQVNDKFLAKDLVTTERVVKWPDNTKNEWVKFSYLTSGEIKGFSIDRSSTDEET